MDKLSSIFENPDANIRKAQLSKLAQSLHINFAKAKNEKGDVEESRLAILIFEELKGGQQRKRQHLMIIVFGIIFFIVGTIAMYAASRIVASVMKPSQRIITDQAEE